MCGEIWKIVYWEKIWIRKAYLARMEFCIKVGKFGEDDIRNVALLWALPTPQYKDSLSSFIIGVEMQKL